MVFAAVNGRVHTCMPIHASYVVSVYRCVVYMYIQMLEIMIGMYICADYINVM